MNVCVCDTWPAHLKNGSSVNSENSDAADWQNATVKGYTRRYNTIKNIHEVISNNHLKQLYGFSLSNQQSKNNWVLIFIPIFPGEMSEFFLFFFFLCLEFTPPPLPEFQMSNRKSPSQWSYVAPMYAYVTNVFVYTRILPFIIHQIFSLARDWPKRVTWPNIPQLNLGNIRDYNPPTNFRVILLATLRHVV